MNALAGKRRCAELKPHVRDTQYIWLHVIHACNRPCSSRLITKASLLEGVPTTRPLIYTMPINSSSSSTAFAPSRRPLPVAAASSSATLPPPSSCRSASLTSRLPTPHSG